MATSSPTRLARAYHVSAGIIVALREAPRPAVSGGTVEGVVAAIRQGQKAISIGGGNESYDVTDKLFCSRRASSFFSKCHPEVCWCV
jgi:hypothetical protein